jgi:hypothetical protein
VARISITADGDVGSEPATIEDKRPGKKVKPSPKAAKSAQFAQTRYLEYFIITPHPWSGFLTPPACAAAEWRRSRNVVDVAVTGMVMHKAKSDSVEWVPFYKPAKAKTVLTTSSFLSFFHWS